MSYQPSVLAVATYPYKEAAEKDFKAVWGLHHEGELDHVAAALVVKTADGDLKIDRHDTTAKHLAWGGAVLGGALAVVAAPIALVPLSVIAVDGGVLAGAGGIIGHFHHNIPKEDLREMSDLLESGEAGLVIVAVDKKRTDVEPLLQHATKKIVSQIDQSDFEAAYNDALKDVSAS